MQILGIVGRQASSKTTLITRLVPELRSRGVSASTVKHAHHGFDIDTAGKDSFRHREAGATEVLVVSGERWALMHELAEGAAPTLEELVGRMAPVDLVLVEGFKTLPIDKIEVRGAGDDGPSLQSADETVIAVVADLPLADAPTDSSIPTFGRDDIAAIADFIMRLRQ